MLILPKTDFDRMIGSCFCREGLHDDNSFNPEPSATEPQSGRFRRRWLRVKQRAESPEFQMSKSVPENPHASPPAEPAAAIAPAVSARDASFALLAGFLGWALDAFDFFLVAITIPQIAETFGVERPAVFFSLTLTLAFRPVGALIFGLMADRYGRRIPMMVNLVFYSAVEVATGFSPNFAVFLVLRALFGIGMGGEWGVRGVARDGESASPLGAVCSADCCSRDMPSDFCWQPWPKSF